MKGLLVKDFSYIFKDIKILLFMLGFYLVLFISTGAEPSAVSGMIMMVLIIMVTSSFTYDDSNNWNIYALTMPVNREDIVFSKYILVFSSFLAGIILSLAVTIIVNSINGIYGIVNTLYVSLGIGSFFLLHSFIMFPVIFKYGEEKTRILMMGLLFIPILIVSGIIKFFPRVASSFVRVLISSNPIFVAVAIGVILLGVLLISMKISLEIVKTKEF